MTDDVPICQCGFNPFFNPEKFTYFYSETGMNGKIIFKEEIAECIVCHEKLVRRIENV